MAQTLDDVLARRTRAVLQRAHATVDAASAAAELLAPEMGWTNKETKEQVEQFTESTQKELLSAGLEPS
jgi:glycerol-3-phosphate dehydrogenase